MKFEELIIEIKKAKDNCYSNIIVNDNESVLLQNIQVNEDTNTIYLYYEDMRKMVIPIENIFKIVFTYKIEAKSALEKSIEMEYFARTYLLKHNNHD